jgi:hypothetical protein
MDNLFYGMALIEFLINMELPPLKMSIHEPLQRNNVKQKTFIMFTNKKYILSCTPEHTNDIFYLTTI